MANSFINKKVDLTTTDLTTLYTVPSFKTAVVKSLLVSEDAGSGSTITITLVNSSGTIFNLFKDKAIGSKATTELLTQPLVMEEGEILKVQAADFIAVILLFVTVTVGVPSDVTNIDLITYVSLTKGLPDPKGVSALPLVLLSIPTNLN